VQQHMARKDAYKKRLVLSIAWLVLVAAGTAEVPQAIQAQWTRFQAAIKADDLPTVIAMSKFPIRSNEFGGDIPSAKVLTQRYTTIFPAPTRQCLATAPLHRETWHKRIHYEVWCDVGAYPIRFLFTPIGSTLSLTSIDNVNEEPREREHSRVYRRPSRSLRERGLGKCL